MKQSILIASTTLLATASAELWGKDSATAMGPASVPSLSGSDIDPRRFVKAYRNPDATNSIDFSLGGDLEDWTWRVNITEIPLPDASDPRTAFGNLGPDAHIIAISHDLQWPDASSTLNETMQRLPDGDQEESELCVAISAFPLLPNATNQYQDNTNGSCLGVLGRECLDSILDDTRSRSRGDSCGTFRGLDPSCAGVFGDIGSIAGSISGGVNTSKFNFPTAFENNTGLVYLNNSDSYYAKHSRPYGGGPNETNLEEVKSMLHLAVFTGPSGYQEAVCMRVDPSIDDEEVSELSSAAAATMNGRLGFGGLLVVLLTLFMIL